MPKKLFVLLVGTSLLAGCSHNRAATPAPSTTPAPPIPSERQVKFRPFTPPPSPTLPPTTPPTAPPTRACSNLAISLLLDTSSSMARDVDINNQFIPNNRLANMKQAVNTFASQLNDQDVIGVQEFNGTPFDFFDSGPNARVVVPFDTWANNRGNFSSAINSLRAKGSTHTRDGFGLAQAEITAAKSRFPSYTRWVMIFISDGIPKSTSLNVNPYPDLDQDPREDPNLADQIKGAGVRVISIGLDLQAIKPQANIAYARRLIRDVASGPQDVYEDATADQLEEIYRQIGQSICQQ